MRAGRGALPFIFVTVMLNSMGIGLIMPVMPALMEELGGGGIAEAAAWGGWLSMSYALMQLVMSPTLGNLSDAYGRKPVLLLSLLVMGIDYLAMATAQSLTLLFAARIMAGAAAATFSTANAFIADVTPPEKRAQAFGLTGAAFGLGFVIGPALGGLLGEMGARAPFWAAAALSFGALGFGLVFLPESLPKTRRRPFSPLRGNALGVAIVMARRPATAWLLIALLVYNVAHFVYPAIWSYYAVARFGWSAGEIGASLAAIGIGFVIVQGFLIGRIVPWIGPERTAVFALLLDSAAFLCLAFATAGWMAYAAMPFAAMAAVFSPALQTMLTNRTPESEQGELQGAISSLSSLAFVITPVMMSQIFFAFTAADAPVFFPGAPFLAAFFFSLLAIVPLRAALRR